MRIALDLKIDPFSRKGSYYAIIDNDNKPFGEAVNISTCLNRGRGKHLLFALKLCDIKSGKPIKASITADSSRVTLSGGGGKCELCIEPLQTLRIRSEGVGFSLQMPTDYAVLAYPQPAGRWAFSCRHPISTRYMLDPLQGQLKIDAPWNGMQCDKMLAIILPDENGTAELAVDEFLSTWVAPKRRPAFAQCLQTVESDFDKWLETIPTVPRRLEKARRHAAFVNWNSIVNPLGLFQRPAMLMSKRHMDQVWSWDNCFNAMALSYHNPALAWDQFMVMVDRQDEFGCFPDAVNNRCEHFRFSKPPVHGWAFDFARKRNPRFFTRKHLQTAYGWLSRWSNWWLEHRVWPGDSLPHYLHGNDSGWDNSTMFAKGIPLMAPDLGAILASQLNVIAKLADELGMQRAAREWAGRRDILLKALRKDLWRGDHFVAITRPAGEEVHCDSLVPNIPIMLGRLLPADIRKQVIKNLRGFITRHGLATERPDSPHYESNGYWRGPIWAPSTMLVVSGLHAAGEKKMAAQIAQRFCRTCAKSGFAENFDALTGDGLRDRSYTWTASSFMVMAHEFVE